jgi:hypothetical protein
VTFNYKEDTRNETQYGLIAEEVNELYPELVIKKNNKIESVKYRFLPILMLNEMKKQQQTLKMYEKNSEYQNEKISHQEKEIKKLKNVVNNIIGTI